MSFKREGDDPAQLGVLQKRRVADLLANYIPEEEALLLRSGRYACMVCAHRPVFDTLDVLTVHRAGKKHMSSLQRFYGRKCSLQGTAQELEHKEEVRAEVGARRGLPGPAAGTDKEDRPERSAESSSLQQLLPEAGAGGKQLTSWCHPDGAKCCADAARASAEGGGSCCRQHCSRAAGASWWASGLTGGDTSPDAAKPQKKSLLIGPGAAQSPQPREAPGPGAVPEAAERRLDPGPRRQVGEG
ncbi:sodium channel modifier 1 isoform X2 [Strigops habroptila]|uniref:sodium channel modifier 1 isoform X2 n=1 Tax=Strigops habroptila TaxID=2489341 RepID=UPI0011CFDE7F|nr:sodium channel modifier 1 isoform X2 [Strigops habroptila]